MPECTECGEKLEKQAYVELEDSFRHGVEDEKRVVFEAFCSSHEEVSLRYSEKI